MILITFKLNYCGECKGKADVQKRDVNAWHGIYRPPSSNNDYFNCVLNQFDHVHSLNENIILMGDLNCNYTFYESLSYNPLHQIEVLYNMRQLITPPTRVTLTTSTLIDVLFTNDHISHAMTGVYDTALSDHYLIYTVFSKKFCKERTCA